MERYNQCNISAFGIVMSIIGGLVAVMAINFIFQTTFANLPILFVAMLWTTCAGILAMVCEYLGV